MLEVLILRYISLTIILCIFEGFRVRMVAMKVPLSGKGMAPSKEFINLITFLTEEMVRYLKKTLLEPFGHLCLCYHFVSDSLVSIFNLFHPLLHLVSVNV